MAALKEYPLAKVGRGRKTHAMTDSTRGVACNRDDPYLVRDDDGRFGDKSRTSEVHPLGRSGVPTCALCRRALARL